MEALRHHERLHDHKLQAAQLAQQALNDYLRLLNITEVQAEIEQTQKLLASWRNSLPPACGEDDDRGLG
jgi:hypothetical protein